MYVKFFIFLCCLILNCHGFKHQRKISQKIKISSASINDELCDSQLSLFSTALQNSELWAVRLMDTWAKIQAGYLSGNVRNYGDFDSCINFEHDTSSSGIIRGQHCWVSLTALPNSTLDVNRTDLSLKNFANFLRNHQLDNINGYCMPTTCSNEKVAEFLNFTFLNQNDLFASYAKCRDVNAVPYDVPFYLAITIFSIILIIMIASTIYDIIKSKSENNEVDKLLASFSVYTNGFKLFEMTKIKSPNSINCLHGIRVLSIFWIIYGHRIFFQLFAWQNQNDFEIFLKGRVFLSAMSRAYILAVDTFLLMGALLMTWSMLRDCEKGQLNIPRMIWRRYLRYTPTIAGLILFTVGFSDHLLKGPTETTELRPPCEKSWWLALIHFQNYINHNDFCIGGSWYLSADFQLFIISPLIIWPIHKYGKKLLALPLAAWIATVIYIISVSIVFNIEYHSNTDEYFNPFIYFNTFGRGGAWFIGIILGYFLYVNRGKKIIINNYLNIFMWILSLGTLVVIILLNYPFFAGTEPIAHGYHVTFMACQFSLWALSLSWIIFACQNLKTGGIVRWFLSLPQWQPISRMGLSMYLFGYVYQILMRYNQRGGLLMNFWHFVPIYMSDLIIITIISSVAFLAFEAPPLIIEDYVYKKIKSNKA